MSFEVIRSRKARSVQEKRVSQKASLWYNGKMVENRASLYDVSDDFVNTSNSRPITVLPGVSPQRKVNSERIAEYCYCGILYIRAVFFYDSSPVLAPSVLYGLYAA